MTFSRLRTFPCAGLFVLVFALFVSVQPLYAAPGAGDAAAAVLAQITETTDPARAATGDRTLPPPSAGAAAAPVTGPETEANADIEARRQGALAMMDNVFYVFSMLLLVGAGLGVLLLQAGLVRPVNGAAQTVNAAGLCAFAAIAYLLIGYPLMFGGDMAFTTGLIASDPSGVAASPDWFTLNSARNLLSMQAVIAVVATLMVVGAVAERVRFWPLMIFAVLFAGAIYPIQSGWLWGDGWLKTLGVSLSAGAPLSIHTAVGWAGLAGLLVVGARRGRYLPGGGAVPLARNSLPLAAVGVLLLTLGLPSFGDPQAVGYTAADSIPRAYLFVQNVSFQALGITVATAVVMASIVSQIVYRRINGVAVLLAGLGGLVSVNLVMLPYFSIVGLSVAAVAGALVVLSLALMDILRLDDPIGVVPVHLVCGLWGTVAASLTGAGLLTQFLGVAAVGGFVFFTSLAVWLALKFTVGLRGSEAEELLGFDQPAPPQA